MNNKKPGSTLADEMRYKAMMHDTPAQALQRLKDELADWQNLTYYKGFTQAERDRRIAGLKKLIAAREGVQSGSNSGSNDTGEVPLLLAGR